MDKFGVPKKVNRHVLKALYYISDAGLENPEFSAICERVEITMKHTLPVRDLLGMVDQSLQNMAQLGVIEEDGSNFFVRKADHVTPPTPKRQGPKIFRLNLDCQDNDTKLTRREKSQKPKRISKPLIRKGPRKTDERYLSADRSREDVRLYGDICSEDGLLISEQKSQAMQVSEYDFTEPQVQEQLLIEPITGFEVCNLNANELNAPMEQDKNSGDEDVMAEQTVEEELKDEINTSITIEGKIH